VDLSELQVAETGIPPPKPTKTPFTWKPHFRDGTETVLRIQHWPREAEDPDRVFDEYRGSMGSIARIGPRRRVIRGTGNGYWSYPLWSNATGTFYKQDKIQAVVGDGKPGIEGQKLEQLYKRTKAANYTEKRDLLDGLNTLLSTIPEPDRYDMLVYVLSRPSNNWQNSVSVYKAIASLPPKMGLTNDQEHIKSLLRRGLSNPTSGVAFIEFIASCIDRFAPASRVEALSVASKSYFNYFGQDLMLQKEATGMYLELIDRIDAPMQPKALAQYYGLYLTKNEQRRGRIARIDREHDALRKQIDTEFKQAQIAATWENKAKQAQKDEFRQKSLLVAGGSILLIVVVAIMLVFLSIQRIVKKIEAKLPSPQAAAE
jgi:hypothetical protein